MASIVKRKQKYSVVYNYIDENGEKRQKWETFDSNAEAKKRKSQIEYEMESNTFVPPCAKTVDDLLEQYMAIYGVNAWAMSTYEAKKATISHYISPVIGNMKLEDITPMVIDRYYKELQKMKQVGSQYHHPRGEYVTPSIIREVHKTLRSAFNQAIKWELIARNPAEKATLPKEEKKPRDIWTAETLFKALEVCDDDELALAMNLAFSCSLRIGEVLALTWDCVDITRESIDAGRASVFINKSIQRVRRDSLHELGDKGVVFKFPPALSSTHTALILKAPKTKTSVRKVFLPKTVAEMLVARRQEQDEWKELFGDEFTDYNLVFTATNGRPVEASKIERSMSKLIRDHNLPEVVFHSLRHSSITYKLKLNGGDMKSVQGDSGHAQMKMVADVYSHIIDEDRCINAQRMEEAFYSKETKEEPAASEAPMPDAQRADTMGAGADTTAASAQVDTELLQRLLTSPETLAALKTLVNAM